MTVSIGAYILCNGTLDGGVAISELRVNQTRATDVVPELGGVSPQTYDRTGRPCVYAFTVKRTHANGETAEQFILELDSNLPSSGDITFATTGPGASVYVLPNGKVQFHELILHQGATTYHNYSMIGGVPPAVT